MKRNAYSLAQSDDNPRSVNYDMYTKGYNMILKMGFKTGQGLGVHEQGIVAPIIPRAITSMADIDSHEAEKVKKKNEKKERKYRERIERERREKEERRERKKRKESPFDNFEYSETLENTSKLASPNMETKRPKSSYDIKKLLPKQEVIDLCPVEVDNLRSLESKKTLLPEIIHNVNVIIDLTETKKEVVEDKLNQNNIDVKSLMNERRRLEQLIEDEEREMGYNKRLLEKVKSYQTRIEAGEMEAKEASDNILKWKNKSYYDVDNDLDIQVIE